MSAEVYRQDFGGLLDSDGHSVRLDGSSEDDRVESDADRKPVPSGDMSAAARAAVAAQGAPATAVKANHQTVWTPQPLAKSRMPAPRKDEAEPQGQATGLLPRLTLTREDAIERFKKMKAGPPCFGPQDAEAEAIVQAVLEEEQE
jgi:hypothetical protein